MDPNHHVQRFRSGETHGSSGFNVRFSLLGVYPKPRPCDIGVALTRPWSATQQPGLGSIEAVAEIAFCGNQERGKLFSGFKHVENSGFRLLFKIYLHFLKAFMEISKCQPWKNGWGFKSQSWT